MLDSDLKFFLYLETLLLNLDVKEEQFKSFDNINTFFVHCLVHFWQKDYNFQQQQRGEFERSVLRDGVKIKGAVGNLFQKMKILKRKKFQNRKKYDSWSWTQSNSETNNRNSIPFTASNIISTESSRKIYLTSRVPEYMGRLGYKSQILTDVVRAPTIECTGPTPLCSEWPSTYYLHS